ncbi:MAG: Phage portal protein [Rickettsia helvetica]|uniref:Phage portal protein n=1 Tax=Rickettsia helvetica TaxID=35789 RepID=A0ABP0T500_RICHE
MIHAIMPLLKAINILGFMIKNYWKKFWKNSTTKSQNFIELNDIAYDNLKRVRVGIEAYRENVIVYRCINLIAQSAGHVPWKVLKSKTREIISDHPVHYLLKRPNPEKSGADFFSELIASKLLFGNSYILSTLDSYPKEIYLLPALATELVIEHNNLVAYKYKSNKGDRIYKIDPICKMSRVLHLKNYHHRYLIFPIF